MGVLKKLSALKSTEIKAESPTPPPVNSPSPAVSSISSNGSRTLLIHGQQPKTAPKRKAVSLTVARKQVPKRLTNIVWSGLFLMVIIATVIVVGALAENIRRTLWTKVSFNGEDSSSELVTPSDNDNSKDVTQDGAKQCIHRRFLLEHGSHNSEIVHDISSKWSAIVDNLEERCLIFDLHNAKLNRCPVMYPWDLDLQIGVPACRGPLARIAPIRKIMHHICNPPNFNLTVTGETISTACSDYRILYVDKVVIQYFDRHFKRVARRSVVEEARKHTTSFLNLNGKSLVTDAAKEHAGGMDESPPTTGDASGVILSMDEQKLKGIANEPQLKNNQHNVGKEAVTSGDGDQVPATNKKTQLDHSQVTTLPQVTMLPQVTTAIITDGEELIPSVKRSKHVRPKHVRPKLSGISLQDDNKEEESRMSANSGVAPESESYWEVNYDTVDGKGKALRSRTILELMLWSRKMAS